jgi:hypothetical protein
MDGQGLSFINVPPKIVATKGVGNFIIFTSTESVDVTVVGMPQCMCCIYSMFYYFQMGLLKGGYTLFNVTAYL